MCKVFTEETIDSFKNMDFIEIANKIISTFIGNIISGDKLEQIVKNALNFKVPVEEMANNEFIC